MDEISRTLVREKLDTVIRCVGRVRSRLTENDDDFFASIDAQDIVSVNLERAVQSCVDVAAHIISYGNLPSSGTMADSFKVLHAANIISAESAQRMRKAVGLRNLLAHQYKAIDWRVVLTVSRHRLGDFVEFSRQVSDWIDSQA